MSLSETVDNTQEIRSYLDDPIGNLYKALALANYDEMGKEFLKTSSGKNSITQTTCCICPDEDFDPSELSNLWDEYYNEYLDLCIIRIDETYELAKNYATSQLNEFIKNNSGKMQSLILSMPIYKQSTFSHSFEYTQHPTPRGTMMSGFFNQKPRQIQINGVVSNIQQLRMFQTPKQPVPKNFKLKQLAKMAANLAASAALTAVLLAAKKALRGNSKLTTALGAMKTASNLLDSYNVLGALMDDDIMKKFSLEDTKTGNQLNEHGERHFSNDLTDVQNYLTLMDTMATMGKLFKVYYCGVLYTNMAITNFRVTNNATNISSIEVSVTLEERFFSRNLSASSYEEDKKKQADKQTSANSCSCSI